MESVQKHLENSLVPDEMVDELHAKNLYRRRIALGRALVSQKHNNLMLRDQIHNLSHNLNALERTRRESLLVGIKYKHLTDNVRTARQISEFLFQEQEVKRTKEQRETSLKRQQCMRRRLNVADTKEAFRQTSAERLSQLKDKKQRDTITVCRDIQKMRQLSRDTNREKCERIRSQHGRLRSKMRRIEEFKESMAQKNYLHKVEQATERKRSKSLLLQELRQKEDEMGKDEMGESMVSTGRPSRTVGLSLINSPRVFFGTSLGPLFGR